MLSEQAEEILETLWIAIEEKDNPGMILPILKKKVDDPELSELLDSRLITVKEETVQLTKEGSLEARNVVRRHRLAERLLVDLLNVKGKLINETACQLEHILHTGIDDRICMLLGHPRICPHGKSIPKGKCCEKGETIMKLVAPLTRLKPREGGKIAYLASSASGKLEKLMAMGILPGKSITLLQSFPSYLFQVENSQFAVDRELAQEIFVRLESSKQK